MPENVEENGINLVLQHLVGQINRVIQDAFAAGLEVDIRVSLKPNADPPYEQIPQLFARLLKEI